MESFRRFIQSWAGRVLLGLVVLVFVASAFVMGISPSGSRGDVATVDGEPIFGEDLRRRVDTLKQRAGPDVDRALLDAMIRPDQVLEAMIREQIVDSTATALGLIAAPESVGRAIREQEAFLDDSGSFSQARYENLLAANSLRPAQYLKIVEDQLVREQLTTALVESAFSTRQDVELVTRITEQLRDIRWLSLAIDGLLDGVMVSDEEIAARYAADPAGYMTEESFVVDYVELRAADYGADVQVADEEIEAAYARQVEAASAAAERRVAHILVTIGAGRDETTARTRIAEIQQRLQSGDDFAALAAEYSDDALSGARGGDLGFIARGVMEQSLDDALFALKVDQTSAPVRSADGLHLLRVTELAKVDVPDLASQRERLRESLRRARGVDIYHEKLEALEVALEESDDFSGVATGQSLVVKTSAPFGRRGGAGALGNPKVVSELFSDEVLLDRRNSPVITIDDNHALAFALREHKLPERKSLAEVSAQIRDTLLREKALQQVELKAADIQAQVVAGADLGLVAPAGIAVQAVQAANRRQDGVPQEVLVEAFRLVPDDNGKPAVGVAPLYTGGRVIVVVDKVIDGNLLGRTEDQVQARRIELAVSEGRLQLAEFIEDRTGRADIERFTANMAAPAPALP